MAFDDHRITRQIVLDCIESKERITVREIMFETGLSRPVVSYHVKTLKNMGLITKSEIYDFWEKI